MTTESEEIKRLVRERYGSRAKGVIELTVLQPEGSEDAGCCGPADLERAMRIYQEGQLAELPAEGDCTGLGLVCPPESEDHSLGVGEGGSQRLACDGERCDGHVPRMPARRVRSRSPLGWPPPARD